MEEQEAKKESALKGKPRTVLAWIKPCEKQSTLETLKELSVEQLNQVINLCEMIKQKAEETLDSQTQIELEKAREEKAKLDARIAELESALNQN